MERWRDNGQAYAVGLAVLSLPVSGAFLIGIPPRSSLDWISALAIASGAFGAYAAGVLAYSLTGRAGSLTERASLLTAIVMGAAFVIAALPFIATMFIGWFLAWWIAISNIGIPALAIIVAWSVLYLAPLGPTADRNTPRALFVTDKILFGVGLFFSLLGLATIGIALWKLPSARPF